MFAECELIIENDYNYSVHGEYIVTQLAYQNVYNNPIMYHYNIFYIWKIKKKHGKYIDGIETSNV